MMWHGCPIHNSPKWPCVLPLPFIWGTTQSVSYYSKHYFQMRTEIDLWRWSELKTEPSQRSSVERHRGGLLLHHSLSRCQLSSCRMPSNSGTLVEGQAMRLAYFLSCQSLLFLYSSKSLEISFTYWIKIFLPITYFLWFGYELKLLCN